MKIELKTLADTRVAYMRHVGPFEGPGISETWRRFVAWCGENGLMAPRRTLYGVSHDNPMVTPPEQCRYDACVEVDADFVARDGVAVQTLAGGPHACTLFSGTAEGVGQAWMNFFGEGLPAAGYQPNGGPPREIYDKDYAMDEKTGTFTCLLCVPIKPA